MAAFLLTPNHDLTLLRKWWRQEAKRPVASVGYMMVYCVPSFLGNTRRSDDEIRVPPSLVPVFLCSVRLALVPLAVFGHRLCQTATKLWSSG